MNQIHGCSVPAAMRGVVVLVGVLGLLTACDPAPPRDEGSILFVAMAGPTCPVETDPPDPDCAPRPVAGAQVFVMPANGQDIVIAQGETGADGRLTLAVPVGDYIVTAGAVEGLISAPEPVVLSVLAGLTTEVPLGYDTGIR